MAGDKEIREAIEQGVVFKPARHADPEGEKKKIRTKAKKKAYITGAHGSGSAKMKAEIRRRRANRHKKT